ncbi:MAG: diguanylate cyclase [Firmicutes bacterium]|nr:diguanylate cyclase [Bacillota bacterium]
MDEDFKTCAERILKALQYDWVIGENLFKTTSSIGIAIFSDEGEESDILMKHSDQALYYAKKSGRNTYTF